MFWTTTSFLAPKGYDFLSLCERLTQRESVLLHSGSQDQRYSILGFDPLAKFEVYEKVDNSFAVLEQLNQFFESKKKDLKYDFPSDNESSPFFGGMLGFFSYDFGVQFENIRQKVQDDVGYPLVWFMIPKQVVVLDKEENKIFISVLAYNKKETGLLLNGLRFKIEKNAELTTCFSPKFKRKKSRRISSDTSFKSNLSLDQYLDKIRQIKVYLKRGHTYQVNFSQRFFREVDVHPWEIFKRITAINPSPFQAYIQGDAFAVISNSPERLVRVGGGSRVQGTGELIVETWPIKGTMPRGKNTRKDQKNRLSLLKSEKDQAELTMIVDLERNDLGKVCKIGTVKVPQSRLIQGYSHVWHTHSVIEGVLEKGKAFGDLIKAVFPGGSITGCPKKRTMEIIDELEDYKRGVYCGSAGYIDFRGNLDFNIMIRTMFYKKGRVYFHSGGGVVIDSDAKKEYKESLDKAKALMESIL